MCTAGQRVSLTITGPGPSFFFFFISQFSISYFFIPGRLNRLGRRIRLDVVWGDVGEEEEEEEEEEVEEEEEEENEVIDSIQSPFPQFNSFAS